jgi:RimJ/RimL family protein N-acetyltransferase
VSQNEKFSFKKIDEEDRGLLEGWLHETHVSQWWPVMQQTETIGQFLERIRSKSTIGYIVFNNGNPIGYIQYYYLDGGKKTGLYFPTLPKDTVGTDQFIGNSTYVGKGYGTAFIKSFLAFLRELEPVIKTVVVDPEPSNVAAIRCYEKVGFKKVTSFQAPYGEHVLMRYDLR